MKLEWGNVPQWVSAATAVGLAGLAFYGVFFSATSQSIVAYLQSELATRNQRIIAMEQREGQLQQSISQREATLADLNTQKFSLEKRVGDLKSEREVLARRADELGSTLTQTEFSLVKEKIGAKLASTIVSTLSFTLDDELWSTTGVRARTVRPWNEYLSFIRRVAEELNGSDRRLGRVVVTRFTAQCGLKYATEEVRIPAFPQAKRSEISGSFSRDDHPSARKLDVSIKQIEELQKSIVKCFNATTPPV